MLRTIGMIFFRLWLAEALPISNYLECPSAILHCNNNTTQFNNSLLQQNVTAGY